MPIKRIVVAGTGSGVGKTTVTIGLMAAYRKRGYKVQGFKCGPDYIDPTYHTAVTGRASRNLDSWMCGEEAVREIFLRGSEGADLAVIEGVMGMFDGKDPLSDQGSAADIARLTKSPVLLVVDCGGMARSAAAVVKGFQLLSPDVQLCGVIANRVGSPGHYELIRKAVEQECGIPVIGYLQRDEQLKLPERHLGLVPSIERGEQQPFFDLLADTVERCFDLNRLYEVMGHALLESSGRLFGAAAYARAAEKPAKSRARIAVAKDEAFHFYYKENLELLEYYGAELVYFSPLHGEQVPEDVQGMYLGGGFPEQFAEALSQQHAVLASVRAAIARGVWTLAECGGYMVLAEEIVTADGARYPMAGIVPGIVKMQTRLAALGYREVTGMEGNFLLAAGETARGHEFHYSIMELEGGLAPAYESKGMRGTKQEGVLLPNLVAGYTHIHFASIPGLAKRWVEFCERKAAFSPSQL